MLKNTDNYRKREQKVQNFRMFKELKVCILPEASRRRIQRFANRTEKLTKGRKSKQWLKGLLKRFKRIDIEIEGGPFWNLEFARGLMICLLQIVA